MRIGVIGAGALGTEVTLRMATEMPQKLSGSTVFVIDPDRLEERNIPLSRLFLAAAKQHGMQVVGRCKAEVAAGQLNSLQAQPGGNATGTSCPWVAYPVEIADMSWQLLRSLDLLISCTDNALARLEATLAARCLGLPLLDGGVQGDGIDGGRVSFFSPEPEAACYLCGLGEERRAALLAFAATTSLPCTLPKDAGMGNGAWVSASLQQTAQVLLGELRKLLDRLAQEPPVRRVAASWAIRLHVDQERTWQGGTIALRRSASCPWHAGMRSPLVSVAPDQSFAEVLDGLRLPFVPRLQFAWPVCLLAVCWVCGAADRQPRRVAWVRRRGACAHCGTPHQLEPLHTVASVGQNETMAKRTPRQLGWADQQLFEVRRSMMFSNKVTEGC